MSSNNVSFVVRNGLVVNGAFTANSTAVNAAAISATSLAATSNVSVGSNVTINTTAMAIAAGNTLFANGTTIRLGNSSVNATFSAGTLLINGVNVNTAITGNAATAYSNAAAYANTKASEAYSNGVAYTNSKASEAYSNGVTYTNSKASEAYTNAAAYADTKASEAYSNGVAYTNSKASEAYSNATVFSSSATNITSGTLATARLPATVNVATAVNVGANVKLTTSSITVATGNTAFVNGSIVRVGNSTVNATVSAGALLINGVNVNTAITGNAATAYSNAAAYANTKASEAYSNATAYAEARASEVYANATAFSSNASNITSGTLATARLPATANIATAINVGANVNLNTTSLTINAGNSAFANASQIRVGNSTVNAVMSSGSLAINGVNVNTAITSNADAAYSNGVSYTNGKASEAYSNGVTYTNGKASEAYANATTFASNATNIITGTLATARLPATANVATAINIGANVNLTTSSISINVGNTAFVNGSVVRVGNATINATVSAGALLINGVNVNTAITGNAATAYTNAITVASDATNLTTGTVNSARLTGTYNISISGTANNATNFGGQPASFYTNATNITTGTLATARLPATVNVATTINVGANVSVNTSAVGVGNATINTVVSAGALTINGVNVNTAIAGNAMTAYTNATSFASNATNISTGTLNASRLSGTYTINITGTASGNYNAVQNINVFNGVNQGAGYYLSDTYVQASGQTVQLVRVYTYIAPPAPVNVSCVFEGTSILMQGGYTKEIQLLQPGDVINTGYRMSSILGIHKTKLGNRRAFSINGVFCTADHPIYGKNGKWKTMDVASVLNTPMSVDIINGKQIISKYDIAEDSVELLNSGDTLIGIDDQIIVANVQKVAASEDTPVYTIILENDSTFVAGGYLHAALKKLSNKELGDLQ